MEKKYFFKNTKSRTIKLFLSLLILNTFCTNLLAQGTTCATATSLSINGACGSGTISDNSQDAPTIGTCPTGTFRFEGWYKFTVTGGPLNVTMTGNATNRNLFLQLISETSPCTGLAQIACANSDTNNNSNQTETITTNLSNGTYYIKVVNVGNNNNMILSTLCITSQPLNDTCSGATTIVSNTSCVTTTGSTLGATDNNETGDCTNGTEKAVWYQFQAVATTHVVTVDGIAGFDAVLGVISNCGSATTPTGGGCIDATNDDGIETRTLTGLTIGAFYKIQVYDFNGDLTFNGFTICVTHAAPPTITSLSTLSGCNSTDTVIITGTNFTGATAVTIGGTAVSSFIVNSATQITAVVGNGTTGTIAVTTSGGTATSASTFTVNPLPANPSNPTSNSPQCSTPGVTLTRTGSVPVGETWYWQTIPLGTATTNSAATYVVSTSGTYYIRAQNNSTGCWSAASGSVTIVVNSVPTAAITPSPINAATGICFSGSGAITSVSWAATAGATSYDVYFGAGSLPGTLTANVATNSYTTGTLLANTTYYWSVIAKNTCGNAVGSATWTFTTSTTICYCTSTSTASTAYFSSYSTTGGTTNITNNASGYSINGYGNFTATYIANHVLGGTVNFSTTIFGIAGGAGVAIFVDWNKNGVFTDTGENVYNSAGYLFASPSGSFTVPAGASLGSTRMRIVTNYFSSTPVSCNSGITGETEDYTFIVTAPTCYTPNLAATTNITTISATINWTAPTVIPSNGYQYVVSTSNTTPVGAGTPVAGLTANITGLTPNTTYYVFVRSDCGSSDFSTWTPYGTFYSGFCISTSTSASYFIENFSTTGGFSNITNNGSGYSATGYGDFTAQIVSQANSGTVNFLTDFNGTFNTFGFNIWVDWNNDMDFNDAGELVYASGAFVTGASGSFTVPATASIGNHRMRIRADYLSTNPNACGNISSGETEDYTFTVSPPLPCSGNPSVITVTLTSQTTSTVSWTAASPAPANGYQYYLFTSSTFPTSVTGSTAAGITTVNLTGLTPLTTYYVWVRSNCGGALGQGVWIGPISFTQPNCTLGNGTGTTTLSCPFVTSGGFGLNDVNPPAIDCTTSGCANLEATYLQLGETTNYTVEAIPYAPPYQFNCMQNPVSVNIDDVWSPVINLPFNFCFYGNSYSSCVVGSNGILCFDTSRASTSSGWAFSNNLPSTTGALFANSIYGVYHDIDPSVGGEVGYELITLNTGCRALVASWSDVPMFSDNSILYTGMMVLYENTNVIEVFIKEKVIDNFDISPWNGGNAIVGLQNAAGTAAVVAPGRNGLDTNWEVYNEAWRFTPSGAPITSLKWYEGSGTSGPIVGTNDILNVCPAATTTYTAEVTYTLCNGTTIIETDEATVTVTNGKKWDGSVSTDWNVAANWTPDGVPTSLDCVVIPNVTNDPIISGTSFNAFGLNLTVLNGATLQINSTNTLTITDFIEVEPTAILTVKNSASLIQVNDLASNTGNILMERSTTIRKTDYVYWSTPVENFSSAAISPGTSTGYIYKWNPTIANTNGGEGNWVSGNETMVAGRGYIVRGPNSYNATAAAFTATFTGKPNNGIITTPISRGNRTNAMGNITGTNGVTITPNDDNFNLLGNPYPSAIDALSFLTANTNIIGNVSIWTHGTPISPTAADPFYADYVNNYTVSDYINYNGTGSTPPGYNGKIASGQGFFVIMNDGTAATESVTFNNSLRSNTYTNNQFYRTNSTIIPEEVETDKNRIWLSLINAANVSVTTLVGYVPDATYENDRLFDAPSKIGTAMGIYSMINDKSMLIQGRPIPFDQNDIIPLAISIPSSGNYTIAIGLVDGLFENEGQEIYLEDTQLGIIHNLRVAPYSFEGTAGSFETRFKLRYTNSSLGNGNFNSNQTFAVLNNNTLQIQSNQNILQVTIYEVSGKLVKTYKLNQLINHLESEFNFSNGIYLAKIKLESGIIVSKKLMN